MMDRDNPDDPCDKNLFFNRSTNCKAQKNKSKRLLGVSIRDQNENLSNIDRFRTVLLPCDDRLRC